MPSSTRLTDYIKWLQEHARRAQEIKKLSAKGIPQAEIARKMGVSRQRIHQILNERRD